MSKRLLIDARQPEETRVIPTTNEIIDDFEYEVHSRRQLKGNIYLARGTRVEPSLQAAFVEYGGNRQGFLAFSEIHPDYYRIPVEDKKKLLAEASAKTDEELSSTEYINEDSPFEYYAGLYLFIVKEGHDNESEKLIIYLLIKLDLLNGYKTLTLIH